MVVKGDGFVQYKNNVSFKEIDVCDACTVCSARSALAVVPGSVDAPACESLRLTDGSNGGGLIGKIIRVFGDLAETKDRPKLFLRRRFVGLVRRGRTNYTWHTKKSCSTRDSAV